MPEPDHDRPDGAPRHIHIEKKRSVNWLAWLLLALGVLALIFALSRCHRGDETAAVSRSPASSGEVVATTPHAATATALTGTSGLGAYLAGRDAAPHTFTFEKLNFDTAKSDIRPADAAEVNQIAATLKRYPATHVRIAGYADARGSEPANMALGKARADSIKAALAAQGVASDRIDTVSGGDKDPAASNATASGRFENRRTELIVTAR